MSNQIFRRTAFEPSRDERARAVTMRLVMLPVIGAALCAPVLAADGPAAPPASVVQASRGPQLIAFDGLSELGGVSARLGMLAQRLDYTIEVAPDGTPTRCTLSRKFRSPLVSKQLCEVLIRRSRFEPARDAWGTAVGGTYTGSISFDMRIKPDR